MNDKHITIKFNKKCGWECKKCHKIISCEEYNELNTLNNLVCVNT
jgi:hypothetical protein